MFILTINPIEGRKKCHLGCLRKSHPEDMNNFKSKLNSDYNNLNFINKIII